ncbi:MAG TPA: L-histidine N(alpha)-methyltransferase [Myxococcota bacterium]|nr:L-histidine N(alpha)-methyltransferase [Myxococcota bacterium]
MTRPISAARAMPLHDLHPEPDDLHAEVVAGLRARQKTLPCKYLYDARGSKLFDQICELDEYYPTRTEVGILSDRATEIADAIGPEALVIELGSGSSTKTHRLLRALRSPVGYVPVDISREHLTEAADRIATRFPDLPVWPVCADFNAEIDLPEHGIDGGRRLIFFPGSTIGNFDEHARRALLRRMRDLCEGGPGRLLIGIDLIKDVDVLESAYDDRAGVTAAFNLNLLHRLNRELDSNFEPDHFEHRARFDSDASRIEMHLVSQVDQTVEIDGESFAFESGEVICTEHSYKFTIDGFAKVAAEAGWSLERSWTDAEDLFAILLFVLN